MVNTKDFEPWRKELKLFLERGFITSLLKFSGIVIARVGHCTAAWRFHNSAALDYFTLLLHISKIEKAVASADS